MLVSPREHGSEQGFISAFRYVGPIFGFVQALVFYIGCEQLQEASGGHVNTTTETSNIFHALDIEINKPLDSTCLSCGTVH